MMTAFKKQISLYQQVVDVTADYLGPASERFISRQIRMHVGKKPEELTKKDLEKLVDWIRLAIALLSDDSKLVDEFTNNLLALTRNSTHRGKYS